MNANFPSYQVGVDLAKQSLAMIKKYRTIKRVDNEWKNLLAKIEYEFGVSYLKKVATDGYCLHDNYMYILHTYSNRLGHPTGITLYPYR